MLVLSRKEGEAFEIRGSGVLRVVVVKLRDRNGVQIGFEQQDGEQRMAGLREELIIGGNENGE